MRGKLAQDIARLVTDQMVYDYAEQYDCSLMDARATLEAEAYSKLTGRPIDYHTDWRDR